MDDDKKRLTVRLVVEIDESRSTWRDTHELVALVGDAEERYVLGEGRTVAEVMNFVHNAIQERISRLQVG